MFDERIRKSSCKTLAEPQTNQEMEYSVAYVIILRRFTVKLQVKQGILFYLQLPSEERALVMIIIRRRFLHFLRLNFINLYQRKLLKKVMSTEQGLFILLIEGFGNTTNLFFSTSRRLLALVQISKTSPYLGQANNTLHKGHSFILSKDTL